MNQDHAPVAPVSPSVPPQPPVAQQPKQGKGLAISSLVLGILATLTGIFFVGGLFGIIAIILGAVALGKKVGKGMSIAGIITGALGILGTIGAVALIIIALPNLQEASRDNQRKNDITRMSGIVVSLSSVNRGVLPTPEEFVAQFDNSTFTVDVAASGEPTTLTAVYSTGKSCEGVSGEREYAVRVLLEKGDAYCSGS